MRSCGASFDLELREARIAPSASLVVAESEQPYVVMDKCGNYSCPKCGQAYQDEKAATTGSSVSLGRPTNKKIDCTLLIHPNWLRGTGGIAPNGQTYGGSATDDLQSTSAWNNERFRTLKLIEVRGTLPDSIVCPDTKEVFSTKTGIGNVPRRSTFACQEKTCGKEQDVLESIKKSGKTGPVAAYAIQGYCPVCDSESQPYSGRFFDVASPLTFDAAMANGLNAVEMNCLDLFLNLNCLMVL